MLSDVYAQTAQSTNLTIAHGLSNNEVTAIHQDSYGFLWFGTRGGLNRYNGYEFDILRKPPQSRNNLSNQSVEAIAEDKNNTLWIGTKIGGLNSYNILKDSIQNYHPPKSIKIQEIKALQIINDNELIIGALSGLYKFSNGKFTVIDSTIKVLSLARNSKNSLWVGSTSGLFQYILGHPSFNKINLGFEGTDITSIAQDNKRGGLFLGTWGKGLIYYDIHSGKSKKYLLSGYSGTFSSNNTYRVMIDNRQNVWVGTWGSGLKKFDIAREKFEDINLKPIDVFNRDYDIILSIRQDKEGTIWIGTDGGGICKLNPFKKSFNVIGNVSGGEPILDNTHITAIFKDKNGGTWLGTKGSGLNFSRNKRDFSKKNIGVSNSVRINTIFENGEDLWVGTGNGLVIFERYLENENPKVFTRIFKDSSTLSGPKITSIVKDISGVIWVGTQENGLNRLISYDNGKPKFKRYDHRSSELGAIKNPRISCMLVDKFNRLWVGTYNGLYLYNRSLDNFAEVINHQTNETALSNNTILSLAEDDLGHIWVGTQQGLNKLNFNEDGSYKVDKYYQRQGFPNDYIHSILVDENNNIWVTTNKGITKFNVISNEFNNFDIRDGISSNTFAENASFISQENEMFFGGIPGVTYFYPDRIKLNNNKPTIYITGLQINNQNVVINSVISKREILSKALFLTQDITLSHKENVITFSYAALDYYAADKIQYQYRLKGFDKNWVNAGNKRTITYTNLPSGSYSFEVKASNSDQIWNNEAAVLHLRILPPPWLTWWAFVLYALIIGGLLWLSRYITLNRIHLQNKLQIANLNYKKEHEIAGIKGKVFANISHEFRTPLTLILGPLEDLSDSKNIDQSTKKIIFRIQNQTKRLLSLVNQLLDFNKAEVNALQLNLVHQDIVALAEAVSSSFADEASRKNIKFLFKSNLKSICLKIDSDKIESIIYNLLSNAFKFTVEGGEICFEINFVNSEFPFCELIIADTGKGINEEEKARVFDRFYQVKQAEPGKYLGTGIGLALVKDLAELHKGTVDLTDNHPQGSIFKIRLPAEKNFYEKDLSLDGHELSYDENQAVAESEGKDRPVLLVIEDNEDLNQYLTDILKKTGKVFSASDGKEGLATALQLIPDLIVSDVMMPGLNGYELCRTLKEDSRTSHIPIILLTAKSDDGSHIKGIQLGADSYLSKPFKPAILISHVNNLIQSRNRLKELFKYQLTLEAGDIEPTSLNEEFIKNAVLYIEGNMLKSEFSTDELASHLNMSRSTFYRKLKALTGMSGSDFIREIRLKRSASLLKTGGYSVSMAAYAVGFNDLKNFRKSFQKKYNVTPSEFSRENKS